MLKEIENFIQHVRRHSPQARTWRNYSSDLRLFLSLVGDCKPDEVTFKKVDDFVTEQVKKGFKPTTINRSLAAVVSLYKYLAMTDEHLTCPVSSRRHRLREPQRLSRPISEETIQRFFAAVETPRELAMFTILRDCGLRISELAQLKIADLNLSAERPRFVARGKGSHERTLYVSAAVIQAINAYLAIRPRCSIEFVFISYQNKGLSSSAVHDSLVRCRDRAGVTLTAHGFRHHYATSLHTAGMPVTSIQALLGHRWLQTTQNYLQISDEQVRNDYETASKKLTGWTVAETAEKRGPKTALSRICPKISNRMITPLIPSGQHRTSYFLKNTKHGYWKPG